MNEAITFSLLGFFLFMLGTVIWQGFRDGRRIDEAEYKEKEKELDIQHFERMNRRAK